MIKKCVSLLLYFLSILWSELEQCYGFKLDKQPHKDGDLKLVDGPNTFSGTVLVYRGYGWGRICDDHWTMREANVVCRQLGMGHALEAHRRNRYGSSFTGKCE